MAKKTVAAKKRNVKVDAIGQLHVHSSFNNIIVCLANSEGQVISWSSAGKMGFRGSKKNTPYAAQMAAQDCAKVAYDLGLRKVKAYVKASRQRTRIRNPHSARRRYRSYRDNRRNSAAPQRLPSSETQKSVKIDSYLRSRTVDVRSGGLFRSLKSYLVARWDAANRCPECTGNAPEGVGERQKEIQNTKKHLSDVRPGREVKALKAKDRRDSL